MKSLEEVSVGDPSELRAMGEKAAGAVALLSSHKQRLSDELRSRRQLLLLLASSVERQNQQCDALAAALKGCEEMLSVARGAEEEIGAMEEQMASIAAAAEEAL